jgi:hypothetical protein
MTHPKRLYWIVTCLMAAFMLMASIPDILRIPQAVEVFTHLGYRSYLLPFIGIAKTLGVIAVLAPGFRRLKEWAYAGLVFDLIGALYSHLAVGDPPSAWGGPTVGLMLVAGSYLLFRRRLTDEGMRRLQSSSAIHAGFLAGITALTIATPMARGHAQTVSQSAAERMQCDDRGQPTAKLSMPAVSARLSRSHAS